MDSRPSAPCRGLLFEPGRRSSGRVLESLDRLLGPPSRTRLLQSPNLSSHRKRGVLDGLKAHGRSSLTRTGSARTVQLAMSSASELQHSVAKGSVVSGLAAIVLGMVYGTQIHAAAFGHPLLMLYACVHERWGGGAGADSRFSQKALSAHAERSTSACGRPAPVHPAGVLVHLGSRPSCRRVWERVRQLGDVSVFDIWGSEDDNRRLAGSSPTFTFPCAASPGPG